MPIPLLLAPILSSLFSSGLSLLGNAMLAKGQDVIEEKLGVKLKPNMTEEELLSLKKLEVEHEEFLVEASIKKQELEIAAEQVAQANVTERWKADMLSDSWLSKNIRPSALVYLTIAFTGFILIDGFVESFKPDQAYVSLLAELLKMVYAAYFVGRTVEKGIEMYQTHKTTREIGAQK